MRPISATAYIEQDLYQRLKAKAEQEHCSISRLLERLIVKHLNGSNGKSAKR